MARVRRNAAVPVGVGAARFTDAGGRVHGAANGARTRPHAARESRTRRAAAPCGGWRAADEALRRRPCSTRSCATASAPRRPSAGPRPFCSRASRRGTRTARSTPWRSRWPACSWRTSWRRRRCPSVRASAPPQTRARGLTRSAACARVPLSVTVVVAAHAVTIQMAVDEAAHVSQARVCVGKPLARFASADTVKGGCWGARACVRCGGALTRRWCSAERAGEGGWEAGAGCGEGS